MFAAMVRNAFLSFQNVCFHKVLSPMLTLYTLLANEDIRIDRLSKSTHNKSLCNKTFHRCYTLCGETQSTKRHMTLKMSQARLLHLRQLCLLYKAMSLKFGPDQRPYILSPLQCSQELLQF